MNDISSSKPVFLLTDERYRRRNWIIGGVALAVLLLAAGLWFWLRPGSADAGNGAPGANGGRGDPSKRAASVGVATARLGDIQVFQNGLGTAVPRNVVTVHTRVDGQLMHLYFKEGQIVKEGDLIAELDPRPFQVLLTQAMGAMARDAALLKNAEIDLTRYKTLFAQDSVSQQQLDTQAALVRQYEGAVEVDKGQVDSAKLSLTYTRVTAPLAGRIGLRQVDPGNIVHAADVNGLVVITQIRPMTVIFSVPETRLTQLVQRLYAGGSVLVEAWDRDNKVKLATGTLVATDNQIDTTTGTIKLRAEFNNDDYALFPNQFVNARALIEVRRGATVIPPAAVQLGNAGSFLYVVQADNTVAVRNVTLGPMDGTVVAVEKGLTPGEVVVIDGTDRLRDGAKVLATSRDAQASPAAAPAKGKSPDGAAHRHRRPTSGADQPSSG
jgi:multidrug efflux system membrane fusion protein